MRRWLAVAALVLYPLAARANDESDVLRARGARLAAEGKCDEALPLFARALAADPKEARSALLSGRCQIAAKQYADAEKSLDLAASRDPGLHEVSLELAIARYHQENLAGARQALEAARPTSTGDARFELYDGLVLLQEGKRAEGIAALERARKADPKLAEPSASYYEGLALENEGERGEAQEAMSRVLTNDPTGRWGAAARQRLDVWSRMRRRDYWAELTFGEESDSNVVLRGSGVDLPSDISDQRDFRAIWHADAGWQFLHTPDWGAGAELNYTGTAEHQLPQFSYDYLVGTGWIDRRLTERLSAHLQADYAYGWVDGASWVTEVAATPALVYAEGRNLYTRVFGRFPFENYHFTPDSSATWNPLSVPPTGPELRTAGQIQADRNRDGRAEQLGIEQGVPLDAIRTQLTATTLFTRYHAEGSEYSFRGAGGYLQTDTLLPWNFTLLLAAGYTWRGYLHHTTFEAVAPPDSNKRRDQVVDTDVSLEHTIYYDWLVGSVRYHFTHEASNVDVFDYGRHIFGGYLTVRIP